MKKRFSSLVSSLNGGSCMSKEDISSSALPPILYLSPVNPKEIDTGGGRAGRPTRARRRTEAAVVAASGCRCVRRGRRTRRSAPAIDAGEDDMSRARETPAYLWKEEAKWGVSACSEELGRRNFDEEDEDEDEDEDQDKVPLTIDLTKTRRTRDMVVHQRRSLIRSRSAISASSRDSSCCSSEDDERNYYTEDGAEEEEEDDDNGSDDGDDSNTPLSGLGLAGTADSSSIAPPRSRTASPETRVASASAVGMLEEVAPRGAGDEGGRVQESFAVVKKSEDPRGDFRRSMAEMVVEKGIYDAAGLEQLLRCFLSLNSRHHHRAIVAAFADIWQTLFPDSSPNFSYKQ